MSRLLRIGPCYLFSSAKITDPLSTWTNHGKIRGNVIDRYLNSNVQTGKADQSGRTPRADSIYITGSPQDGYELPLLNYQIDEILKVMPGAVKVTNAAKEAVGFSTPASTLTTKAFALVPVSDYDEDLPGGWYDSDHVRFIEDGLLYITGEFSYKLPDGDDILESKGYTCTVKAFDGETTYTGGIALYRFFTQYFLTVGTTPIYAKYNNDGTKIVVSNATSNNIMIVDDSTGTIEDTIAVGTEPRSVYYNNDGTKIVVVNLGSANITNIVGL